MLNVVHRPHPVWRLCLAMLCVAPAVAGQLFAGEQASEPQVLEPRAGTASFNVFLRATPVGVERVELVRLDDGWSIRSSGDLPPPIGRRHRLFDVEYDSTWLPRRLVLMGSGPDGDVSIETTFTDATAVNRVAGVGELTRSEPFDPASIILPDYVFGAYEAMAARLAGASVGDHIPVYVPPTGRTGGVVREVMTQELQTTQQQVSARIYRVTFNNPNAALDAEIWVDHHDRLLRVFLPSVGLDVARQDISMVSTRLTGVDLPGDTNVRIPARGFSLAAVLTAPSEAPPSREGWPAIVLVPGTQSMDRDEFLSGVPIHGRLAAALSEAGYLVVRYDRRGMGQSGGRPESATLDDYAQDVRDVVDYLRDRDDVDRDRIAVLGHGEGGWIGLQAAARERRIAALVLLGTPSVEGDAWVLEQQAAELDRLDPTPAAREERLSLQRRLNAAVVGDGSWDDIPPEMRARADTAWFRSFLEFDPADALRRARQPLLVVHGLLDRRVSPTHADRLAAMGRERDRRESTVDLVSLPGVNHLLVAAQTPDTDDTPRPQAASTLAPELTTALVGWLDRTLPASR